jgi:hypothetical protein
MTMKDTTIKTFKLMKHFICSECKATCTDSKRIICIEALLNYSIKKTIINELLNFEEHILN